jgi:hypothetical protein
VDTAEALFQPGENLLGCLVVGVGLAHV